MKRLTILAALLLLTCWMLPASEPEPTLPVPSSEQPMVPLQTCLDELTQQEQLFQQTLNQLESAFAVRLRSTAEQAAADAARPLLVVIQNEQLALRRWRTVAVVEFVCIAVVSVVFALVPSR